MEKEVIIKKSNVKTRMGEEELKTWLYLRTRCLTQKDKTQYSRKEKHKNSWR